MNIKRITMSLLVLGAASSFFSCSSNQAPPSGGQQAMPYPVTEAPARDITAFDAYPVSIEGTQNIEIRAKIDGYIQQIFVDEGQTVKKGQTLFKLETQSLSQQANASKSAIEVAKAQVNVAQVEVDKLVPLVEEGIISEVQLETAKAQLASAKSQLAQAQSNYRSVSENIDYTRIKSPVNGVVGTIPYRQGTLVGRTETQPLTTVSAIDNVYAYFSMNEKEFLAFTRNTEGGSLDEKLKNIPSVELMLADGSTYSHTGKIQTVTGQINPNTGAISFRAVFPNPEKLLRSGSSGQIRIPKTYKNAVVVPAQATYEMQGQTYVYVVNSDNTVKGTIIEPADEVNNLVVVKSGLEAGQKIVAEGVGKLKSNVSIVPQAVPFDQVSNNIKPVFKN
ncbi:efflux RND transporter periplasmic adaptor subunit [Limibacter armeniacum]|uniref:efflux RND transporter periplasmic adaptor subunit n=1 Tax=Limibacter armeniacum TaxID=466084 RepID=UPI002FE63E51